jgi:tRNA-(ms[2]io[6]A)-hydroxylase
MADAVDLQPVKTFLSCPTPEAWVAVAARPEHLAVLLIDHANCEKKAAATAMSLMHRYVEQHTLLQKMSRLAREELRHFEQVTKIMKKRGVDYVPISASRYAAGLRELARKKDPGRLVDTLIIGALIEARSCERFAALAPHLDEELANFYGSLLKSEARHFEDYLRLAESIADASEVAERLAVLRAREAELVTTPDAEFRFHSGVPVAA